MLETSRIKSVMIVSPHGDDEVLGAGGLISKCRADGVPVNVLFLAVDADQHFGLEGATTLDQRMAEIEAAADLLGYRYRVAYAGQQKLERLDTLPLRELVDLMEQTVNEWQPDLLLLPHGDDYDQVFERFNFQMTPNRSLNIDVNVRHGDWIDFDLISVLRVRYCFNTNNNSKHRKHRFVGSFG